MVIHEQKCQCEDPIPYAVETGRLSDERANERRIMEVVLVGQLGLAIRAWLGAVRSGHCCPHAPELCVRAYPGPRGYGQWGGRYDQQFTKKQR